MCDKVVAPNVTTSAVPQPKEVTKTEAANLYQDSQRSLTAVGNIKK